MNKYQISKCLYKLQYTLHLKFSAIFFKSLCITFFLALSIACSSKKNLALNYSTADTRLLLKKNGLAKLLSHYTKVYGKTMIGGDISASRNSFQTIAKTHYWVPKGPVTTEQYQAFIDYTRDSIAKLLMGQIYNVNGQIRLDWSKSLDWNNPEFWEKVEAMRKAPSIRNGDGPNLDERKITYRRDVHGESLDIPVNQDTNCHIHTKPITAIRGLRKLQAEAYCDWLTNIWNSALAKQGITVTVSLPSNKEAIMISRYRLSKSKNVIKQNAGIENKQVIFLKESINSDPELCNAEFWYIVTVVSLKH